MVGYALSEATFTHRCIRVRYKPLNSNSCRATLYNMNLEHALGKAES